MQTQEQERSRRDHIKAKLDAWRSGQGEQVHLNYLTCKGQQAEETLCKKRHEQLRFLRHQEHLKTKLRLHAEAKSAAAATAAAASTTVASRCDAPHKSHAVPGARKLSASDAARIWARSADILARRAAKQLAREQEFAERKERIQHLLHSSPHIPVHVVADRKRLMRPTLGFLQKRVAEPCLSTPLPSSAASCLPRRWVKVVVCPHAC